MRNILNLKKISIQKGLTIFSVNILCFIFTKTDLVSERLISELGQQSSGRNFLMISNRSNIGITSLRKKIIDAINETKNNSRKPF